MTKQAQGFSMLEVLITILIVSFGLLALAGLQMYGIKSNRTSYYRGIATVQADALIEQMRANRAAANTGAYVITSIDQTISAPSCATSLGCSSAQIAERNKHSWLQSLKNGSATVLPSGGAKVTYDATSGLYEIEISWKDEPETAVKKFLTKAKP